MTARWTVAVPRSRSSRSRSTWGTTPRRWWSSSVGLLPGRRGARRGPPRRGRRAPRRRAVRLARARRRGHGHRGRPDRHADGLRRRRTTVDLARDTVFAAVMITCNGIVGLSLLVGALRAPASRSFNAEGTGDRARHGRHPGDALPRAADLHHQHARARSSPPPSSPSPRSPRSRCTGCSCSCRPSGTATTSCPSAGGHEHDEEHADPPTSRAALISLGAAARRAGRRRRPGQDRVASRSRTASTAAGFPQSVVGVVIALLVLLPETLAAVRARPARPGADQPQPGARLGDGQHRPDDPGDRDRLDLARRPARCSASARPRWCCSRSRSWSAR